MNRDDVIIKLANNKVLLYLVPNFVYLIILFNYYNVNFLGMLEVTFLEIVFDSCLFFMLTNILYLILLKVLKNRQKVFLTMVFICAFYNTYLNFKWLLILLIFTIILVIEFKTILNYKLDKMVFVLSVIISVMFLYNAMGAVINLTTMMIKSESYESELIINVDAEKNSPNIYYIHCDGMMALDHVEKYFGYDNKYLREYLKGYYVNEDATLVAGHRTQRALVALFNPNYYDKFFNDYLNQLEETYLGKKKNTEYFVDYYELEDKRFNNELIEALKMKGYTTVGIGEYNAYTALDMDYYYDFFNSYKNNRYLDLGDSQLRLITNNSDEMSRKLYIRFSNNKKILKRTILSDLLIDYIPIMYEEIDYNKVDVSDYTYINKVYEDNNYWVPKAIIKGLSDSMKINDNRVTFIDFNMNHDPYLFSHEGDIVGVDEAWNVDKYLGNYIYSSYILTDIVNYIRSNDQDAVIILQGDHGLHTVSNEKMAKYFEIEIDEMQEIRNSVISVVYVPKKYQNGDELYLDNPLNISRYLVNNFVGNNYEYIS